MAKRHLEGYPRGQGDHPITRSRVTALEGNGFGTWWHLVRDVRIWTRSCTSCFCLLSLNRFENISISKNNFPFLVLWPMCHLPSLISSSYAIGVNHPAMTHPIGASVPSCVQACFMEPAHLEACRLNGSKFEVPRSPRIDM